MHVQHVDRPAEQVRAAGERGAAERGEAHVVVAELAGAARAIQRAGAIVASASVRDTVLGYDCFVHAGAHVEDSIILSGCDIGRGARLRKVILDKNCKIEPGCMIGDDPVHDAERFPFVTESGIVVVPKGTFVPAKGPCVLANDVAELLNNDPELSEKLKPGSFVVSMTSRHSYESAGPRFERYSREHV